MKDLGSISSAHPASMITKNRKILQSNLLCHLVSAALNVSFGKSPFLFTAEQEFLATGSESMKPCVTFLVCAGRWSGAQTPNYSDVYRCE